MANCKMSGTPDLTLLFTNPNLIEDCSFHPCVRYSRYEKESVVSFVPPDGVFQLMTYRVVDRVPNMPVYCRPTLTWRDGSARASFLLATKAQGRKTGGTAGGSGGAVRNATGGISSISSSSGSGGGGAGAMAGAEGPSIEDVRLDIVFPPCVRTVDLTSDVGQVTIDPSTNVRAGRRRLRVFWLSPIFSHPRPFSPPSAPMQALTWIVGRYPRDKVPELVGTLHLAPGTPSPPLETPQATMSFRVDGTTVSGVSVRDLLLTGERYKFFKMLRMGTKSGRYQVRT